MSKKKPTVYAFGFDKAGFATPGSSREEDGFILRFVGYKEDRSLEEADGLVIPSGIFEEVSYVRDYWGKGEWFIKSDTGPLATREKQFINATERGVWTVFLLGGLHNGSPRDYRETDLAKKMLNAIAESVQVRKPEPSVTCKADEFRKYLDAFGVAQTTFWVSDRRLPTKVIAEAKNQTVGIESKGQSFFLPFFTEKRDEAEVSKALLLVVASVLEYKRKHEIYLPAWVKALQFKSETRIRTESQLVRATLTKLTEEAERWERYKAVLCTSGQNLNAVTTEILRDFFGLNLKSEEKYVEDALVYSPTGEVKYVVEIKGVNGGIKRENINQIDSHRERLGITSSTPGLLIVNDFMDVEDFDVRKAKTFDPNNLTHASSASVKVLRAVTLIEWMFNLEEGGDRQAAFFEMCDKASPLVEGPTK